MSDESVDRQERMAKTIRLVVSRRERAPRSPKMERALKRLIWRYSRTMQEVARMESVDVSE
jgi:hypothetical protein